MAGQDYLDCQGNFDSSPTFSPVVRPRHTSDEAKGETRFGFSLEVRGLFRKLRVKVFPFDRNEVRNLKYGSNSEVNKILRIICIYSLFNTTERF